MTNPFPDGDLMTTHPRLRVGRDDALYVVAYRGDETAGEVQLARFNESDGTWTRRQVSVGAERYPDIELSNGPMRTGPQFAFDVGFPSILGNDEIRIVYTSRSLNPPRLFLKTTRCSLGLACADVPEWSTSNARFPLLRGDQFNPVVVASPPTAQALTTWKLSYQSREYDPAGQTNAIKEGNLTTIGSFPSPSRIFIPFDLVPSLSICQSTTTNYWGDYDDIQYVFAQNGAARFIRTFSDSTAGCVTRLPYTSSHVHVSERIFP